VGTLYDKIRQPVADEKYIVGDHAAERLAERGIMEWQAVAGLEDGKLLLEDAKAKPNPKAEVGERMPDGTEFKAVW
jgi:hypothetical protein